MTTWGREKTEDENETKDTLKIHIQNFNTKALLKSVSLLLVALLIASSAIALFEYNQTMALQKEFNQVNGNEAAAYYNEFGVVPNANVNSSLAPPISMYQALIIGLKAEGWTKKSLQGMKVGVGLVYGETQANSTSPFNTGINGPVTSPPASYVDVYENGIIYRYIWEVTVNNASYESIPPLGFSLIDASTGEVLPNPILI